LVIVLAAALAGCLKTQPEKEYAARVGDAVLTNDEVAKTLFPDGNAVGTRQEQLSRQFVSNWITSELLYQEAKRKGFTDAEAVRQQLEVARRQLGINAYLEKEIYADDSTGISTSILEQEFNAHREAYRLREDVVNISFVMFDERDAANAFRSSVLRGASWNEAVEGVTSDADAKRGLLRVATKDYFTQSMLYPEELWKIARTLSKEDVSYVVKTSSGYCVVLVHDSQRQGELPDFEYARNEIKERVMIERRNAAYNELLSELRSQYTIEVRNTAADSTQQQVHE
jgi:hypothetical protein